MLATIYSLGTLLTIVLAVYGIGRPALRVLRVSDLGVAEATIWSVGLGFVISGWLLSVAVLSGLMTSVLIGLITIAGAFWGMCEAACVYLELRNPLKADVAANDEIVPQLSPKPPGTLLHRAMLTAIVFCGLSSLLIALAPPTSADALGGSIELPKRIALEGAIGREDISSPKFGGLLYSWALVLDGPVAASLMAWFFGMMLSASAALLTLKVIGQKWCLWASLLVLSCPGIAYQMSAPFDDLIMATFVTMALAAWWRGAVDLLSPSWSVLAGAYLGAALATNVVAVAMLLAAAVAWCIEATRRGEQQRDLTVNAARCVGFALVIAGPWWAWVISRGGVLATCDNGPATLVQLGPVLIALFPGLAIVRRLRGLHLLVWMALCYAIAAELIVPRSRIFAPLAPLLATIGVWVFMEVSRFSANARRVTVASLSFVVIVLIVVNGVPIADRWRVAVGLESRTAYLRARVGAYAAAEIANRITCSSSRIFSQDNCHLYFDSDLSSPSPDNGLSSANTTFGLQSLCDAGYTHVLLCSPALSEDPMSRDRLLTAPIAKESGDPHSDKLLSLTKYRFTDERGKCVDYQLLMLR